MRPALALAAAAVALALPLAATAQECVIPDLLVALDTSGSMSEPGGDGRTKWESAVDAVGRMATSYDSSIRWGLELFPGNEQCSAGIIAVPIAATGADVRNALARTGPGGGTPIAESLAVARQHLAATNDGRPHYVLLVTDGQPNCNGNLDWQSCDCTCSGDPRCTCQEYAYNCLDDRRTQDEIAALAADGVPTFVVGFGAGVNPAVLNSLAGAGGTARPGAIGYYDASDTRSLAAALDAIAAELVTRPCASACGPGVETCTEQGWQGCSAPQVGDLRDCGDGFEGVCGTGVQSCGANGWSECSAATPGTSRPCHTACGDGVETCLNDGKWTSCVGAADGDQQECESGCGPGLAACQEEGWGACFGEAGVNGCGTCGAPPAEVCNGIDDDCDGVIDDGVDLAACGSRGCSEGACRQPCFESSCAADEVCNGEFFCVPRPCEGGCGELTCTATGCADPCAGVHCPDGRVCSGGACVEDSCLALGCALGQACMEGSCLEDPCNDVRCPAGEYCRAGACVGSCAGIECSVGWRCEDGACAADACAAVTCAEGEACSGGSCAPDPCAGFFCPGGRICDRGTCVTDPCLNVSCPTGEVCAYGGCYAAGEVPPPPDPASLGSGADRAAAEEAGGAAASAGDAEGAGCGCGSAGSAASHGTIVLLLAALPLLSRRRGQNRKTRVTVSGEP